jgi:hypothetical protein
MLVLKVQIKILSQIDSYIFDGGNAPHFANCQSSHTSSSFVVLPPHSQSFRFWGWSKTLWYSSSSRVKRYSTMSSRQVFARLFLITFSALYTAVRTSDYRNSSLCPGRYWRPPLTPPWFFFFGDLPPLSVCSSSPLLRLAADRERSRLFSLRRRPR